MDNNEAHPLARGHIYKKGEVPLFALAIEIARTQAKSDPSRWIKDGANNDLRFEIISAMQTIGIDTPGLSVPSLLKHFIAMTRRGEIFPKHPHLGLPPAEPDAVTLEYFVTEAEAERIKVVIERQSNDVQVVPVQTEVLLKRKALIDKYKHQWKTIERDLSDASTNKLSEMAKSKRHGYWIEAAALSWAKQQGKFKDSTTAIAPERATPFAGLIHRL